MVILNQTRVRLINKHRQSISRSQTSGADNTKGALGQLRIIGGTWRSRRLPVLQEEGLRPTTDRVRETLFNWLQNDLPGSRCLDLFAGSGALGLESASRGAEEVVMIEKSITAFKVLQQNVDKLKAVQIKLLNQDALLYLKQAKSITEPLNFDIVFLDPPYQSNFLPTIIGLLVLAVGTKVYLESQKGDDIETPSNWLLLKDKTAGQIHYRLYEIEE